MAGLTKQHFIEIAGIINKRKIEGVKGIDFDAPILLIEDLSNYFKTQNPLFNENQFKKACLE